MGPVRDPRGRPRFRIPSVLPTKLLQSFSFKKAIKTAGKFRIKNIIFPARLKAKKSLVSPREKSGLAFDPWALLGDEGVAHVFGHPSVGAAGEDPEMTIKKEIKPIFLLGNAPVIIPCPCGLCGLEQAPPQVPL